MTIANAAGTAPVDVSANLDRQDLRAALAAGWDDFKAMPAYGLFFAFFYMLGGIALYSGMISNGQVVWFIAVAAGFPILAPFAAIGMYEVSRRREAGQAVGWAGVVGALRGRGNGQLPLMAVMVLIVFGFWVILARGIFAIFFAQSGIGQETVGMLLSAEGMAMLAVGTLVGALIALALFSITVVSLPMLLDRDVDFVTAMIASVEVVRRNRATMMQWAGLIAVLVFLSMLPFFLGLLVTLPVLGHATWPLYRRAIPTPARSRPRSSQGCADARAEPTGHRAGPVAGHGPGPRGPEPRKFSERSEALPEVGWGTWIRTRAARVRAESSTAKLSPKRARPTAGVGGSGWRR